ncbi:hypothetical protein PILCRDRAFT_506117 [Piloderma croceum F 1598]|uniref:RING-type domain-containing protein n=1 Tax=Piloderma croceum (strain F 1598) TaxID=765440 RepID=A0A0C3FNF2_PILCF|nr:hypothetical protein PILCRDRAFT_506117 [Piloderma croceum F 1598]
MRACVLSWVCSLFHTTLSILNDRGQYSCIDSLSKPICPLCRTGFEGGDIRRLHIDRGQSPSRDAYRYQTDITRIVKQGAPASKLRALIDECHIWLKSQPHDQHEDLRVSFLLLYNLTETQRKLATETEAAQGLRVECETLRTQIDTDRDAAEQKYAELERSCADEKETALAVERSLRDHYEKLNGEWQRQYDTVAATCKQLAEELKRAKYPYGSLSEVPRSIDMSYFYSASNMDTSGASEQPMNVDVYGDAKLRKLANEDMFHLSPLPVNIPPLPSAIQGFSALAEDDDAKDKDTRANSMSYGQKSVVYEHSLPRASIQPIPIPNKSHVPRVSSGLTITVPETLDLWGSGTPLSFPHGYDVPMGSCSISPVASTEQSIRGRPTPSQCSEIRTGGPSPNRSYHHDGQCEHERERSPIDQREHRRVQLHDLLNSQRSSSLPANSHLQSILSSETRPSASRSYSLHSVSQTTVPTNPSPAPTLSTSVKSSPSPVPSQSHGGHHTTNPIRTAPLISHASSAAIQLERDRLRAEKERESSRERERDCRQQEFSSGSLRDTTNAHAHAHHWMGNSASGKVKMQVYT